MRVLLAGAGGQVGRLVRAALSSHEVLPTGRAELDIRDPAAAERVVRDFRPEAVILAAGMANADACEDNPSDAYAVNIDAARTMAAAARNAHFTIFSTDHVFDGKDGPYAEDARVNPLSVYGRTKAEGERIVLTVHPRSLVVRTSLVYALSDRSFFTRLIEAREPVPCWKDHFGTYTWGPNLGEATAELVERGATGIWHVAGPGVLDRHAFALKVARRFGKDPGLYRAVSIHDAPPRAARPLRAGLRVEKAQAALRTKLLTADEALELAYESYGRLAR